MKQREKEREIQKDLGTGSWREKIFEYRTEDEKNEQTEKERYHNRQRERDTDKKTETK